MGQHNNNNQEKISWMAPARPNIKSSRYQQRMLVLVGVLLSLILFFLAEYLLIFGVWAVLFVFYVRLKTPAPTTTHEISRFGVQWYGTIIPYGSLQAFSFIKREDCAELRLYYDTQTISYLSLFLPENKEEQLKIKNMLEKRLPYLENPLYSDTERLTIFLKRIVGL